MKNPKEYKKPIAASMGLLNVLYIVVSLVVYKYCGSESLAHSTKKPLTSQFTSPVPLSAVPVS